MAKDWWEESALESAAPKNESADEWWRGAKLENAPKRTWGEAIKDTGAQLAEGVNTTLGAIPSVVAPQSRAAGFFRDNAQYWRDQQSDVLKDRIAASDQRIQEAGKDGVLSQIGTAASEYWNDPAQAARLVATNLPSMAATLGTGAAAGLAAKGVAAARGLDAANKAALAAKYGTTTAAATNAALNAGGARGEAFEDLQKTALAQGMTPEQAEQAGVSGSILPGVVGGVAGAISGKIGLEKAILGQATTGAAMRKAAGAFGAELAGEQIEELAPKVATNYQAGRIDPGRTLTDDLGRTVVETAIGSGPGAIVAGGAAGMRGGDTTANTPPAQDEFTTSPGAADPNAPSGPQATPPEAPDLTISPGAGVARDGMDFTRDVDTSGLSLQDPAELARQRAATVDYQPGDTTPQWDTQPGAAAPRTGLDMPAPGFDTGSLGIDNRTPSERMGLDPAKGSLTSAAALAVDTGASPVQFLGATGRDMQLRQSGPGVANESNVIDVQGRVVEDRAIGTPRRLTAQESAYESGAQAFRDGAPRAEIVATQNVVARAHQLRGYDDAARQASTPALPAPSNLREGLERIRAQKQEAANAQATAPQAAPASAPVPAAGTGAVEAAGMKPAGQRQLSADEQAAQDREEARAKEPSLPPVLSARLQEAHKAHGRDVKRSVVERSIANEKANNTGTPKAKRERADRIARLEADLALFDEASAMPPKEAAGLNRPKSARKAAEFDARKAAEIEAGALGVQEAEAAGVPTQFTWPAHRKWVYSQAPRMTLREFQEALKGRHGMSGPDIEAYYKSNNGGAEVSAAKITTEGAANVPQADQAQQTSPQPAQAGAAPAAGPAPTNTAAPAPAGASTVRALSDGTPTANTGAQAAPATGAQAAAAAESKEQRAQRVAAAGEAWTRMPTVEREAMAGRADGLNPMQRKNVQRAAWADLSADIQRKLADAMDSRAETGANQAEAPTQQAQAAIKNVAEQAAPKPEPAPVRLGRNNAPLNEGGKPFKTRKAAGDAKKLQPMMRVVTVPGGYALAEKTPAQLAAEERASRRLRNPNTSAPGEPIPAHAFIAAAGGLNRAVAADLGVEGNPRIGNRTLLAGQGRGLSIEQATQMLIQDGYLSEGALHNDAYALIKTSLTRPQYNEGGIERIAKAEVQARFEDYLAAQEEAAAEGDADPFGMADEFTAEELDDVGYTDADPALQAEVAALIAQAEASGIDTYAILEDIAKTYANATQDQYNAAARDALAQTIARSNQDGGSTAAQAAPASESSAGQGLNQPEALGQQAPAATENVAPAVSTTVDMPPTRQQESSPFARFATGRYRISIRDEGNGPYAEVVAIQRGSGVEIEMRMPGEALDHPAFSQLNARAQALFETPTAGMFDAEPPALELAAQTPAEAAAQQAAQEQAAKAEAARQRAADAQAARDEDRKRIAQASVRAAAEFELGQDPLDSLTGQGSMFDDAPEQPASRTPEIRYELPPEKSAQQQGNESWMAAQSPSFKPTARQQLLMDAVAKALDDGAFYNRDVDEHVAQALGVTPEQRARNSHGVEGGDFGFDVYNASKAVEAQRSNAKSREFANALNLKPGDVLGTLVFNDGKVTTGVKVIGLNESGLIVTFTGKRGAATLNGEVGVDRLAAAMDRAKERGKRKDGFAEFVESKVAPIDAAQQAPTATEPVAQPITRADVEDAQQQAATLIAERIDAMTAGEVNTIARRFLPTMGVKPTVSKERNKAAVTDFTKVNPMAAAAEFGVTLPADVRRALEADFEGRVADAGQDDGLAARADGDDDYLRTLFGGSDTAEQDAVSPAQTQKIDAKAAVPMLRALAQEKRAEAEDWSGRKYKGNKSQVNLRGDGPSNQETMSVSAVNESRRRKAMESLAAQANAADKLADRIESGSINIQSALDKISRAVDSDMKRDGGKPSIGKSRQDMFEGYISSQLLADPYAGYGEGTVSSALRAMYEERVADGFVEQGDAPMFSRTKAITPAQRAENFARWSDNAPLISSEQAEAYDFKTGQKIVVEAFHGSARPDRIGGVFDPKRATSGPMAYFTSSPELASSYAKGKADTSLADEDQSYANWFKFKPPGARSAVSIDRAWHFLTPEVQARIRKLAPQIAMDDTGENIVIDPDNTDGLGNYGWELQQARGNPLAALVESWLGSGTLFNEETKFMDVLRMAGFPVAGVEMDFPNAAYPGVFKTYVSMKNPLVVGDMPADVRAALEQAAKADRTKAKPGADMWDKRSHTLRDWWAKLNDPDPQTAAYAWTSIPDKVTDVLKAYGYDGIVDWSGKGGGHQSPVYIPFGPTQVKSVFNRGTFDPTKKDISFGRGANAAIGTPAATIRAAITKAYGKLLGQLESKGLVTLTQTEDEAIEAAAQARAEKTGQSVEQARATLRASVKNSVADQTQTEAFKRWFKDSKAVDADGKPLVVYHGTNVGINEFKPAKGLRSAGGLFESSATSPFKFFSPDKEEAQSYANAKGGHLLYSVYLRMERPLDSTTPDGLVRMHRLFGSLDDTELSDWADSAVDLLDGIDELRATTPAEKSYFIKRDAKGRVIGQRATEREGYILEKYTAEDHAAEIERDLAQLIVEYEALLSAMPSSDAPLSVWAALDEPDSGDRLRAAGFDGLIFHENDGKKTFAVLDSTQIKSAVGNNGNFDPNDPDIRRSANGAIQGFFDPQTGQSFLIADNLTAEAAPGVLMHEVGIHMAADGSMKALFNRAAMMLKMQRGNPFMKAVQARMDAAGETSGEEAAAYIAEAYENDRANAPASVKRWLADLLAAVKAWMFKKGIMGADRLTVADIAAVARANARSMARDGGATGGQGFGTAFSRAPAGDQTQTDGATRFGRREEADLEDRIPTPSGHRRLYHGGQTGITEISADPKMEGNIFGGLFASANIGSADSHERGAIYFMDVPEEKIATSFDLGQGDWDVVQGALDSAMSEAFGYDKEYNWREHEDVVISAVLDDKNVFDMDEDEVLSAFIPRVNFDVGGASWEAQRIRGAVAKALGFKAVEMNDEHGTSYLVLPGTPVRQAQQNAAHEPGQAQPAIGNRGTFDPTNPDIRFSRTSTATGTQSAWDAPTPTGFDDVIYKLQDKNIDLKRVVEAITKATGQVADSINAYLKEELFHKRAAKRVADFGARELKPLMNQMRLAGLSMEDVEEYLHARHAKEANAVIAQRNPGNAGLQDGGSGMTNAAADNYFAKLDPAQRRKLESVAAKVDAIIADTRKLYVDYGLEDQAVVDGWANMYQHYIPLMREDKDGGMGTGQGFSVKGRETKGRTGSTRKVVDILANIASQRERLIVRGEKNRVTQALVGLAQANPNPEFWEVRSEAPTERVFDQRTGVVVERPDPLFKSRDNVVVAKVKDAKGKVTEQMVVFNEDNPRAVRMAAALKNLDAGNLEGLLGVSAKITRYFAAINTQYNPVFGVVNLVRDVQGAMVNLAATPLAGQQSKIAKDTLSALRGIYGDIRKTRRGGQATSQWSQLWEQMQDDGGTTGYRELFTTSADRANNLKSILNPESWMDNKWGKVFTANGKLRVPMSIAQKGATEIFGWLSDYNEAMENGVRLAAYKAALDNGMSREQAASIAKNLTVNFNRKGQAGMQAGAVYAFFNAAMQGTARIGQTLFDMDGGDMSTLRLSKTGKAVVYGGVMLGVMQALALSAAGFDDDDPPEFVRERSLIIPTGGKTYVSIPMPLGLHVIPGIGRHAAEFALSGFDKPAKRAVSMVGMFADAFNPIGNAGLSMQTIAPTALDPLVALSENKDWTGKPIARVSSNKALPGHTQWKDTATGFSKVVAEAINWVSGGNEYVAGAFSPTPDQIDYLIAQLGGGVAREAAKVQQTVSSTLSGEELPTYKVPLVGRFVGNAASQASQGSAFYANLNKLNELETEIKGLQKDGRFAEASQLIRANPQAILIAMANRAERDVQKLRREKRELIAKDASREEVRAKEEQITAVMTRLNEAAERRKALATQ